MSVLYKALQKAEKENEARHSASSDTGFDPQRLAASGALKLAGGRGRALNRAIMGVILLLAFGGGGAYLVFQNSLAPAGSPVPPPQDVAEASPAPAPAAAPMQADPVPLAGSGAPAPTEVAAAPSAPAVPPEAAPSAEPQAAAAPPPAEEQPAAPAEQTVASVPPEGAKTAEPAAAAKPAARPAARPVPEKPEPMPQIPVDSPARMLSPPIAISRTEFALSGVGNLVQVREVSQSARSSVAAGYDALVRGSYDTALGFYDEALKEEPTSVLALLGRGAALQKLGRGSEAQGAYDQVLKLDPQNREALTNLTAVVAERSPQEALTRLVELEREYPSFSPIKAQIGLNYAKIGAMPQALEYLRRAVALSPDAAMYHYNLALVLDHLGLRDQAVASYERVLASISGGRGPSDLAVVDIERRVRFLKAR